MADDSASDDCQFLNSFFGFVGSGFFGPTVFILALVYIVKEVTMGICDCTKKLDGTVVIITGANSGSRL